jgi:hypothetical protein
LLVHGKIQDPTDPDLNTGDNLRFMVTLDLFARRYYEDLQEENKRYPGEAPFPWLEAQFKQLGLDVYRAGGLHFHITFSILFYVH